MESGIQRLESGIHVVESEIHDCLRSPYMRRLRPYAWLRQKRNLHHQTLFASNVISYSTLCAGYSF